MKACRVPKKIILISAVVIVFLTTSILTVSAQPRTVTKTIRITLNILPKAELNIDDVKIEDVKGEDVTVDKVIRNGVEMIRITKVFEEALY